MKIAKRSEKGESKNRPVATNFQFLKILAPLGQLLVGACLPQTLLGTSTANWNLTNPTCASYYTHVIILYINSSEYDYHTLVKVAEMAGLAGLVGFHESEDGYIVSFPDTENTQALINDYKARLRDLENNIWQH